MDLKVCKIDREFISASHGYEVSKLNKLLTREGAARARLEDEAAAARAWYRSPALWGAVGLVAGVAAGVGMSAWAVAR